MSSLKWLDRGLVISPVCFALCLSEAALHKELRRLKVRRAEWPEFVPDGKDACVHFLDESKEHKSIAIVCVRYPNSVLPIEVDGVLVHEAVHIWQEIRDRLGESRPSKEFEAYSIQAIAQRLMASYRDQTKKRKQARFR